MKKFVVPLLLTLASTHSMASTTEMTLTGTLTPSACTPALGNGGVVDYGQLSAGDLEDNQGTGYYNLPAKQLSLSIQCASATAFALTTTDNRHDSADISPVSHGLGMHKGQKVGILGIGLSNPELDGIPANILVSLDGGQSWLGGMFQYFAPSQKRPLNRVGFGGTAPVHATRLSANLDIESFISKTLPFHETIQIDGSTTFNIVYL